MIANHLTPDALLLSLTWLLPVLTIVALAFVPATNRDMIRRISLGSAILNLGLVAYLIVQYAALPPAPGDARVTQLAFAAKIPWFQSLNIHYFVGLDGISLLMMLLAAIVAVGGVLVSWTIEKRTKEFFIFMNVLLSGVFGCFISFDLFTFFLFNEITLIPTYLLIGIFGSGRKEYAAMKLNLMLIGGSALILTGMLGLFFESAPHSWDILELSQRSFDAGFQRWSFPLLFLGFGVLGALFPFHTWSPDGHSSAPTAISMFLAGVHMKLGGYGCLRVATYILPEGAHDWMNAFLVLSTINILYGAFVATKQTDLKYLNAYSSVSHCGLVLFGFAAMNFLGVRGAVLQMFSHGLMTALFFALIGMVYQRTHTREIAAMGGLMRVMPFIGVSFMIAALGGLGLPGLSGFVAELNVFLGGVWNQPVFTRTCTILAILSIVVAAVYLLRAVHSVFSGPVREGMADLTDATPRERIVAIMLIIFIVAMGVVPSWVTGLIDSSVQTIVNNINR